MKKDLTINVDLMPYMEWEESEIKPFKEIVEKEIDKIKKKYKVTNKRMNYNVKFQAVIDLSFWYEDKNQLTIDEMIK